MTLVIACPTCQQKIRAPKAVLGRSIKCPQCKNPFIALDAGSISEPAAPEPDQAFPAEPFAPVGSTEPAWQEPDQVGEAMPERGGSKLVDFLLFRRMVTPMIIVFLFYFGVVVILGFGLFQCVLGFVGITGGKASGSVGVLAVAATIVGVPLALVVWRIVCEVLIAMFRILDNLREINDKTN